MGLAALPVNAAQRLALGWHKTLRGEARAPSSPARKARAGMLVREGPAPAHAGAHGGTQASRFPSWAQPLHPWTGILAGLPLSGRSTWSTASVWVPTKAPPHVGSGSPSALPPSAES